MTKKSVNSSAGIGDPYWYEWGIGLIKAVEMLNPDKGIEAIAFQKSGVKGWDDLVVQFSSGRFEYYQIKHSRPRYNLTFSDLLGGGPEKSSLLNSLARSWHEMGLAHSDTACTILTNRSAGTNSSASADGTFYPPLAEFLPHIAQEARAATSLSDIEVPSLWRDAWDAFLREMDCIPSENKLKFIRTLKISCDEPQLEELKDELAQALTISLGVSSTEAKVLLTSLISALFEWTTTLRHDKEWISAEDVVGAMAVSDPDIFGICDIPTPAPFFPSRERAVERLKSLLLSKGEDRIIFLEAEPGSGKTSVISRIVNQRAETYSELVVDIRYFAYKPITPDSPALPMDAGRSASPEALWYTLLSQLRERLRGRLFELQVPVRNQFISSEQAREHVLRLSQILSREKKSPFVIVIDGIDHAARALRKGIRSLLDSLPSPEAVPDGVRLLIAGQLSTAYPEYPIWLKTKNEVVRKISLDDIDTDDICALLSCANVSTYQESYEAIARVIQSVTEGNTLAIVFAIAECHKCSNVDELESRLLDRNLHTGVHNYYIEIWRLAIPASPTGVGVYLAAALCLIKQRVSGQILQEVFSLWNKSAPEWDAILQHLEPLVVRDPDGYRVRHNDIRVFLEQELKSDAAAMEQVASLFADYYMGDLSDPLFRQLSLFQLLGQSGRDSDKARVFSPAWVLEAVAFDRDLGTIFEEAEQAFKVLPNLEDWSIALEVACAGQTLQKVSDELNSFPDLLERTGNAVRSVPHCLETERFVVPFSEWSAELVGQVLSDADRLIQAGESDRAKSLLEHWLSSISPKALILQIAGSQDQVGKGLSQSIRPVITIMEDWGRLSFELGVEVDVEPSEVGGIEQANARFESAWVSHCVATSEPEDNWSLLKGFNPRYLDSFEHASKEAAKKGLWTLVAKLLRKLTEYRGSLSVSFQVHAAYWSLLALSEEQRSDWISIIKYAREAKVNGERLSVKSLIVVSKAVGWCESYRETASIASELTDATVKQGQHVRDRTSLAVPFRAAAMVGVLAHKFFDDDLSGAAALVPAAQIMEVIRMIWDRQASVDYFEFRDEALDLTYQLIEYCLRLGDSHTGSLERFAIDQARDFPVDHRMPIVWDLLRRSARREEMYAWAQHWIGEDGAVWSNVDLSQRADIVQKMSELCRVEGWTELSDSAEGRLRRRLIGYSTHKEYAFLEPLQWLEELLLQRPHSWKEEGLRILELCQLCTDQGGDNRLSSEVENEVSAAAFRCGANDAWQFFEWVDSKISGNWLRTIRDMLISASERAINEKVIYNDPDACAIWCCTIGLSRWFDNDSAQMVTGIRDAILDAAKTEDRPELKERLYKLSPGDFIRERYNEREVTPISTEPGGASGDEVGDYGILLSDLRQKVQEGYEPSISQISRVVKQIILENSENRRELVSTAFQLVGANNKYMFSWDKEKQFVELQDLFRRLNKEEAWQLMRSAIQPVGNEFWLRSITHNIHLLCLCKATVSGVDALRQGVQRVYSMHSLWADERRERVSWEINANAEGSRHSWAQFVASVLTRLLDSDSSETLSAAIRGLCALNEVDPDVVPAILSETDGLRRSRLLLASEVCATRNPERFSSVLEELWAQRKSLTLSDRVQLWVCRLSMDRSVGGTASEGSFINSGSPVSEAERSYIETKPSRVLDVPSEKQGSFLLANAFSVAQNWLYRINRITSCETDDLEGSVADKIHDQLGDDEGRRHVAEADLFAVEHGDMKVSSKVDRVFDQALDGELRKPEWRGVDPEDLAVAITNGDDPWVISNCPKPSDSSSDWPKEEEIEEWLRTKIDAHNVLNRMMLIAQGEDLSDCGQRALGSYFRVFTRRYDLEIWYWLNLTREVSGGREDVPISPCSRCFQFLLKNEYEAFATNGKPLVSFPRSMLRLSYSSLEVLPSRILQTRLGWHPDKRNPLKWKCDGKIVAKYETLHSSLDDSWRRRHSRETTLSRWVVSSENLDQLGNLEVMWNFQSHPFSGDVSG